MVLAKQNIYVGYSIHEISCIRYIVFLSKYLEVITGSNDFRIFNFPFNAF